MDVDAGAGGASSGGGGAAGESAVEFPAEQIEMLTAATGCSREQVLFLSRGQVLFLGGVVRSMSPVPTHA